MKNIRLENISSTHGDGGDPYMNLMLDLRYTMMLKEERLYCAVGRDLSRPIVVSLGSKTVLDLRHFQDSTVRNVGTQSRKLCHIC